MEISFRPVTVSDLAMLETWISQPHWQEWWGDPKTETGYIRDMVEGRDTTRPFIFRVDNRDTGYIQTWTVADQMFEPWLSEAPWMKLMPEGTIGVDISIADPGRLSGGIGSRVLHAFAMRLWEEGHREIIIDPDPANRRAVAAYAKAGFTTLEALAGKTGDYHIMKFDPDKASITQ